MPYLHEASVTQVAARPLIAGPYEVVRPSGAVPGARSIASATHEGDVVAFSRTVGEHLLEPRRAARAYRTPQRSSASRAFWNGRSWIRTTGLRLIRAAL